MPKSLSFLSFLWRRRRIGPSLIVTLSLLTSSVVHAELRVIEERVGTKTTTVYQMSVTPAPEPVPALRHRLVVRPIDMQPGNAALHYLRLFPESNFQARLNEWDDKYGVEFDHYYYPGNKPLSALPLDQMRAAAASFDEEVKNFIAPATLRRDCDWGLDLETLRGPEVVQLLLPEFNASRQVSRLLALRARVAIADGDYERALAELRMNYRLAENVGSERLLVCSLIGVAQTAIGHGVTLELIAAPKSPNLYWALSELRPATESARRAIQFEMSIGPRVLPVLQDAETAKHTPEEWARLLAESMRDFGRLQSPTPSMPPELTQAALSTVLVAAYPMAKQRLITQGMEASRVEAMPVAQVIVVDAAREYQRIADALEKRLYEPYSMARRRSDADVFDGGRGVPFVTQSVGTVLAQMLLPSVQASRNAAVRSLRHTLALQTIEALRMHAAEHGKLPDHLDEIKIVAVPLNPVTNQPFVYHVAKGRATLELPESDGLGDAQRFEIALAQ